MRGNSRKMARALKLLNRVMTCAMEYRGGKEQKIWIWSGLTSISSMEMSYCSGRCFKSVDSVSDCPPKLVPIDEEPDDQIVHLFRLGENWLRVFRRANTAHL